MAAQEPRATTATPDGTGTTSVTPGTRRAAEASNDFTVAPNRGGRAITAVSMSGRRTSYVYSAEPVVLARESTRGAWRPISLKSFGSLSVTCAGGVSRGRVGRQLAESGAAAGRRVREHAPVHRDLPGRHLPRAVPPPRSAWRARWRPARRSCSQELAMDVLPPVPCMGPQARLL